MAFLKAGALTPNSAPRSIVLLGSVNLVLPGRGTQTHRSIWEERRDCAGYECGGSSQRVMAALTRRTHARERQNPNEGLRPVRMVEEEL